MLMTNFPVILPVAELCHLLKLELNKVRTAEEYYEEVANACFAVGCCTRYFARRLVANEELEPIPEGVEYADYVAQLVYRLGGDSSPSVYTPSEATYILSYALSVQSSIELPVKQEAEETEQEETTQG